MICRVTLLFALWAVLAPDEAVATLDASQVALVLNAADPFSVEVGRYYLERRHIPLINVIRIRLPVGQDEISRPEFEAIKAQVDAQVPATVQAYALAWTVPFRVECLSITTAFAFGFDAHFCAEGCGPTKPTVL